MMRNASPPLPESDRGLRKSWRRRDLATSRSRCPWSRKFRSMRARGNFSSSSIKSQTELRRIGPRRLEQLGVEFITLIRGGKSQFALCQVESRAQQFRVRSGAAHAGAELRVIVLAAARLIDQRHDVLGAI